MVYLIKLTSLSQKTVGRRSSTHVGQIQGECAKRIYSKQHRTFDGFIEPIITLMFIA